MEIYIVKRGDTIFSIANNYGITPERLAIINGLELDDELVVGQSLIILIPEITHTVTQGQTLFEIANIYDVSVINLLQNNPQISQRGNIYPGETIVIKYNTTPLRNIAVNGYTYPNIDRDVLIQTLPYLTYMTVFTYGFTPEGELIPKDDEEIISLARDYSTAPIMLISTLSENGTFSNELSTVLLNDENVQNILIENILNTLREKNYYGLDVDFEYIKPEERERYVSFLSKLTQRLNSEGFIVIVALAPKTSSNQRGLLYEAHDYANIASVVNYVLLMTYEWGYTFGPPLAVAPINKVREVLNYAITQIDANKIFLGIPNYGYDWTLPYVEGSRARSLSNMQAIELAQEYNVEIQFDVTAQTPYFNYTDDNGNNHVVWFEDARSIYAKALLVNEYGFYGASWWNIMRYFPQGNTILNSLYTISKII